MLSAIYEALKKICSFFIDLFIGFFSSMISFIIDIVVQLFPALENPINELLFYFEVINQVFPIGYAFTLYSAYMTIKIVYSIYIQILKPIPTVG